MSNAQPTVSIIVPVLNERDHLPLLLECIDAQSVQPTEVLILEGGSDDGTREWLAEVTPNRPTLRVIDNPERVIPAALNLGLAEATGDVVARMDAHARYAPDYLERCLEVLTAQPEVAAVGGAMTTAGEGVWGQAIATVLSRPFGLGGARHRVGGAAGPIEHVFTGVYRRAALEAVGGFDPALLANEDYEADFRIRRDVGPVWLQPAATSTWFCRTSPRALARQMWAYGFFKARTLHMHPSALRPRQLAPPLLLIVLVLSLLLMPRRGVALAGIYVAATSAVSVRAAMADGTSAWRAAVATPVVHVSWGAGLLAGLWAHRGAQSNR